MTHSNVEALPFVHGYVGLGLSFSQPVAPTPLAGARLLHGNARGCALIDLEPSALQTPEATQAFAGGAPPGAAQPVAMAYSGHQFGMWAGQLGDGRAILLGEVQSRDGELWDVQLKGAGRTPFSRSGDGRAVLRSTLREYVAGEAMAGLGIATTRSLAIYSSDEDVQREELEKGALLVRLARCHVRIGTFEHFHAAEREDRLRVLFGYCLGRWFPRLSGRGQRARAFLHEVAERNARLIAQWMSVGFCHGVMNTDNMSILGETIDYGPYAFLDDYNPEYICNCSDTEGRYAYGRQPSVGFWNMQRFAEALLPLMGTCSVNEVGEQLAEVYGAAFEAEYRARMADKLGVDVQAAGFKSLLESTLAFLSSTALDYTRFWRELSGVALDSELPALSGCSDSPALRGWWSTYAAERRAHPAGGSDADARRSMLAANPKYVARNYLLQELIAEPDPQRQQERLEAWLEVLARPFDEHPQWAAWASPPVGSQKAISIGCSS